MSNSTLNTYFPKAKNSAKGLKYLVTGVVEGYYEKVKVMCNDCHTETFSSPSDIFFGRLPCKCGHGYYRNPERRLERLKEKVALTNFIVDYDSLKPLKTALDLVPIKCGDCGFCWEPVLNSIICGTTGCQRCAGLERYSEEYYIDKINSIDNLKFISKVGAKLGRQEKVVVECTECKSQFTPLVGNLFQGKGCSVCANYGYNPSTQGFLYILSIRQDDGVLGYKFGITNSPEGRVKRIQRRCSYDVRPVFILTFPDGKEAASIESSVKRLFGNYFTKDEMPDGFTETVGVGQVKDLINYIHSLVNQKESYGPIT
jgi:hypothetical protein